MKTTKFLKLATSLCICMLLIHSSAFTQKKHSFQLEFGTAQNSGKGIGPSIGFTYGIKVFDRLFLSANLNYSMHSRVGFVNAIDPTTYNNLSVVHKHFENPVSNEPGLYKDGLIEFKPHDWVFSTVIFRPGIIYNVLRSKRHELNFRLDAWITYGNRYDNGHVSYENYFYSGGDLVVEDPVVVIIPIETSAYGFGYGFGVEYLYGLNENYFMGLGLGHGDSYSLVYSLNFVNALLKYKF